MLASYCYTIHPNWREEPLIGKLDHTAKLLGFSVPLLLCLGVGLISGAFTAASVAISFAAFLGCEWWRYRLLKRFTVLTPIGSLTVSSSFVKINNISYDVADLERVELTLIWPVGDYWAYPIAMSNPITGIRNDYQQSLQDQAARRKMVWAIT